MIIKSKKVNFSLENRRDFKEKKVIYDSLKKQKKEKMIQNHLEKQKKIIKNIIKVIQEPKLSFFRQNNKKLIIKEIIIQI